MNSRKVLSLYAHNGDNKIVHCQVFNDSYRFTDFKLHGVNSGIIESNTPLESAYAYAKKNSLTLSDNVNGGHSG